MKRVFYTLVWTILFSGCTKVQQQNTTAGSTTVDFELTPENAHPNAKALLTEEFYWSPIEETGPFGNDDGSDSFYEFVEWRNSFKTESPLTYFNELVYEWSYTTFDLKEQTLKKF